MNRVIILRWLAVVLIVLATGAAAYAALASTSKVDQNTVFASHTLLEGTWNSYKQEYWEAETGRTLDKQQNDITTSEGQSYTMLRSVWMSDKATFDTSWDWTKEQLQREDNLFSWRWGQRADGSYGVLTDVGGQNAASDAEVDIALALLMAAGRWQQESYLNEAKTLIDAIWEHEVVEVQGKPYLTSNNLEKYSQSPIVMNPSYFAPYAFREFAKADTDHDWMAVVDSSYEFLNRSIDAPLDKSESAGLPPDWVLMDRNTGELSAPTTANLTTNYSYDAMRVAWRLAMDYEWNQEPRAKETLEKMSFLGEEWENNQLIYSTYSHGGEALSQDEVAETYGTTLGYFDVVNPDQANEVYEQKIKTLYDQNTNAWKEPLTYYASNWVWFGIGLQEGQLTNLVEELEQ
jgi:endoglucanase